MTRWLVFFVVAFSEVGFSSPFSGVNLPSLQPYPHWVRVYESQDFTSNVVRANWNTFRLPITWEHFTQETGELNPRSFDSGVVNFKAMIEALKRAHLTRSRPGKFFLILDFHQYKFGRVCGGIGIPASWVQNLALDARDPTCFFKAFEAFWKNEFGLQDAWIAWMQYVLLRLGPLLAEHEAWLQVGLEPLNEPFWGLQLLPWLDMASSQLLGIHTFNASSLIQSAVRAFQRRQINRDLLPFYRRLVGTLESNVHLHSLLKNVTWVFQPYLLDHVTLKIPLPHLSLVPFEIVLDGDYSAFLELRSNNRSWIAAPHHYFGARDNGFIQYIPAAFREPFLRYPNNWANARALASRFNTLKTRMLEAGMNLLIGEWGTDLPLLNSRGTPGGHVEWIRDSQDLIESHTLGSLWWSYDFDTSSDQSRFYLLSPPIQHQQLDWSHQRLKCEPRTNPAALMGWCD